MKAIIFALVVLAALLIIVSGVWVGVALIAAIFPRDTSHGSNKLRTKN